jgi:hypothetical protein
MKEIKVGDLDLTGALVELMHTEPDTAEPILLKMLGDPQVDQLLAEMIAKDPTAKAALVKMSTHSEALKKAFARVINRLN